MSKQSSSWLAILAAVGCPQSSSVATFSKVWVMVSGLWALPSLLRLGLNDITQREFPQRDCPHKDSYAISLGHASHGTCLRGIRGYKSQISILWESDASFESQKLTENEEISSFGEKTSDTHSGSTANSTAPSEFTVATLEWTLADTDRHHEITIVKYKKTRE